MSGSQEPLCWQCGRVKGGMGEEKGISGSTFFPFASLPLSLCLCAASGRLACTVNVKSSYCSRREGEGRRHTHTRTHKHTINNPPPPPNKQQQQQKPGQDYYSSMWPVPWPWSCSRGSKTEITPIRIKEQVGVGGWPSQYEINIANKLDLLWFISWHPSLTRPQSIRRNSLQLPFNRVLFEIASPTLWRKHFILRCLS